MDGIHKDTDQRQDSNVEETAASNQKVCLTLPNGATYYGEVKNNKPHGKGTMRWGPSNVYSCDWYNGQRSGTGKYISDRLPEDMRIVVFVKPSL
ncbi:hypothetical protein [Paenibacillus sp. ISL-20]|uniref:hypothetical protein n=1 Tax=Paenibacillus sp. ISL-20 TaxID=2819163 RepID=UPI003335CB56